MLRKNISSRKAKHSCLKFSRCLMNRIYFVNTVKQSYSTIAQSHQKQRRANLNKVINLRSPSETQHSITFLLTCNCQIWKSMNPMTYSAIAKTNLFRSETTSIMNLLSFITLFPLCEFNLYFWAWEHFTRKIIYERSANDFGFWHCTLADLMLTN